MPSERSRTSTLSLLAVTRRLMLAAVLIELLIPLVPWLPDFALKPKLFNIAWTASSALGIAGFLIAYRVLRLREDAADHNVAGPLFGPRLRGGMVVFFIGAFLLPLVNLVIFVWTYFKAGAAIDGIRQQRQTELELRARRDRVMRPG